jgi:hypothetical protein
VRAPTTSYICLSRGVTWLPRIREVGWFKTGKDGPEGSYRYADRHPFLRLQQDMNGPGEWTLELHDCHRGADVRVTRVYDSEHDARTALACVYVLTRHLGPLPDRFSGPVQLGRWAVRCYDLSEADRRQLARFPT